MVPMGTMMPFGNRFYHPIWEACENHGLPVVSHVGGGGGSDADCSYSGGFSHVLYGVPDEPSVYGEFPCGGVDLRGCF